MLVLSSFEALSFISRPADKSPCTALTSTSSMAEVLADFLAKYIYKLALTLHHTTVTLQSSAPPWS